eukprot:m.261452 g.261452  ORF g.261452 m.261452 type:complete len:112 (+) comp19696_c0_seq16:1847-2182(+)
MSLCADIIGKHFSSPMAVMDTELFDYELVYGMKPTMDKKTRLIYNDSLMTHAMVSAFENTLDIPAQQPVAFIGVLDTWDKGSAGLKVPRAPQGDRHALGTILSMDGLKLSM